MGPEWQLFQAKEDDGDYRERIRDMISSRESNSFRANSSTAADNLTIAQSRLGKGVLPKADVQ